MKQLIAFVENYPQGKAIITSLENIAEVLKGDGGTQVYCWLILIRQLRDKKELTEMTVNPFFMRLFFIKYNDISFKLW